MTEQTEIPKLSVLALRAHIEGGNSDPQVVAFNVARYRELLAQAAAVRDEQSIDILSKAIEEFSAAPRYPQQPQAGPSEPVALDQGVDPDIPDSPGSGPEPLNAGAPDDRTLAVLKAGGYELSGPDCLIDYVAIRHATDEELLAVKGIGPSRLKQIREMVPKDK